MVYLPPEETNHLPFRTWMTMNKPNKAMYFTALNLLFSLWWFGCGLQQRLVVQANESVLSLPENKHVTCKKALNSP